MDAPRPRQVTLACVVAGVGAAITLAGCFATLSDWGSEDLRDQVAAALGSDAARSLDVSLDQAMSWVRVTLMAVAAVSVTALISAVFTARGHRGARVLLSILSGLTAVTVLFAGLIGIVVALVAVMCIVWLWNAEARRWFAVASGAGSRHQLAPSTQEATMTTPDEGTRQPDPSRSDPPPYSGYAQRPPAQGQQPPGAYAQQYPPPGAYAQPVAYGHPGPGVPTSRPGAITTSGVVALVMSSIALLGFAFVTIAYAVDRPGFENELETRFDLTASGIAASTVSAAFVIICVVGGALAVLAMAFAILLLRNSSKGRIPLVVLSIITAVFALLFIPFGLLWSAAGVSVAIMLSTGKAAVWFEMQRYQRTHAGPA